MASSALAAELQVAVSCPAWTPEAAAQVEARIRTSALAESTEAQRVSVSCETEPTRVEVESLRGTVLRPVVLRSGVLEDDVVATAQEALHELAQLPEPETTTEPTPAPTPSSAPAVEDRPPPPPAQTKPAAAPGAVRASARPRAIVQVQAGGVVERWGNHWAPGGEASMFAGSSKSFRFGLALGGRDALGEPASFAVTEWNASARLLLVPAHTAGFQGELGAGASWLVAKPARNVTADSSTVLALAYLELSVSRPFSLGWFALAPALGARVFSGRRNVEVNDQERLAVPVFVPEAALWLVVPAG